MLGLIFKVKANLNCKFTLIKWNIIYIYLLFESIRYSFSTKSKHLFEFNKEKSLWRRFWKCGQFLFTWGAQHSNVFFHKDRILLCSMLYWLSSKVTWGWRYQQLIEIGLWHGCSPVKLLHIFRPPFSKNTSGLLLKVHLLF